jgi:hypothetical protein
LKRISTMMSKVSLAVEKAMRFTILDGVMT